MSEFHSQALEEAQRGQRFASIEQDVMEDRYDVIDHHPMGRLGYVFDLTAQPYIKVDNTAPHADLPYAHRSQHPYSAADQDPPYPLSFNDFRDGAGQWNLGHDRGRGRGVLGLEEP